MCITLSFTLGDHTVTPETDELTRQASGAGTQAQPGFLPLTVDEGDSGQSGMRGCQ